MHFRPESIGRADWPGTSLHAGWHHPCHCPQCRYHRKSICDLHTIINPTLPPNATVLRVGIVLEPNVLTVLTTPLPDTRVLSTTVSTSLAPDILYPRSARTSIEALSCNHIRGTRFVHLQVTCNNNPFAPLADDENPMTPPFMPRPTALPTKSRSLPATKFLLTTCPHHALCHAAVLALHVQSSNQTLHSAITPRLLQSSRAMLLPTMNFAPMKATVNSTMI